MGERFSGDASSSFHASRVLTAHHPINQIQFAAERTHPSTLKTGVKHICSSAFSCLPTSDTDIVSNIPTQKA
jgi:hypothetical protein